MARKVEIVPADLMHIEEIAPRLRQADIDEMWSAYRHQPLDGLTRSLEISSEVWAGSVNSELVCLFGIGPICLMTGRGTPWFVATDAITRYQFTFLTYCAPIVDYMLDVFPHLENQVDARNKVAIRWLKWLGFEIHDPQPFGFDQLPFHRFTLHRKAQQCVNR